ncbi:inositol monophosphatase family protein [Isoptericola cucumis]|uniref:inositol monophosphatase family protein n=1 Tax=Isoptericola cucumis TaxID=1776856 RepID=UPI0032086B86
MTSDDAPGTRSDAELAVRAAMAGAAEVADAFGGPLSRQAKSGLDFATDADLASERAVRGVISAARPRDRILGEELGGTGPLDAGRRWYVDPLCGTLNFAAGTPPFCVNVALGVTTPGEGADSSERFTAAAVADPQTGEVSWTDGTGAWLRRPAGGPDLPLQPSAVTRLVTVNVDGSGALVGPRLVASPAFRAAFGVRVSSSTLALAWVAAGKQAAYVTDGSFDGSVHFAAALAVCEAAGCVLVDLDGGPVRGGRGLVAAADTATAHRILALIDA